MQAVRWHARRDVRVDDVAPLGSPPPGWARLRVDVCGICGTDVEEYLHGPVVIPAEENGFSGQRAPLTLGHEPVGVVEEVGDGVGLGLGTRVAVEANVFCGTCFWCLRHEYPLCEALASLGQQADGALAEQVLAPAYMCLPYSDHVPAEQMALAEPLAVAVRAIRRAGVVPGSSVGVVGAGTIGLLALQVARIAGARLVMSVEAHEHRRSLAAAFGADVVVGPGEADQAAKDLTGGIGLDITIEAAGNAEAATSAIGLVRRGGRVVLLGVYEGTFPVDMMDLLIGEKEIIASLSHVYDEDFARAVELLDSNAVTVAPLISDRLLLGDVVSGGFERLVADPNNHLKILIFPNGKDTAPTSRQAAQLLANGQLLASGDGETPATIAVLES